jgi:hypothetical protein
LENINTCKERTVVLNLVWLEYDFNEKLVTIEYYVKDKDYPSIKLSFGDFIKLLKKDRHK